MDLPAESTLIVHTLESPRFVVAILILTAGFVWFGLRYRSPRQALIATASLLAAAAGLVILASLVETTGERLTAETRSLVEAAVSGDAALFGARLDDALVLRVGREKTSWSKSDLVDRVKALGEFVKSNNIREVRAVGTGDSTGEAVLAQTTTTHLGQPTPNEWRFRWRRDSSGTWRITELIWEQWGFNETPSADLLRN